MVAARWRGAGVKADRDQESRNANQSLTQNARDPSLASQAPDGEGKSQEWMRSGSNGYGQICLSSRWTWWWWWGKRIGGNPDLLGLAVTACRPMNRPHVDRHSP